MAWLRFLGGVVIGCLLGLASHSKQAEAETVDALVARCAPTVHPTTMTAVVRTESGGKVYAIADAGPKHLPWSQRKHMVRSLFPNTQAEAVAIARDLIARGHTVSLGLSQVNDRNLAPMGMTLEGIFEPCNNLAAGGRILTGFYERAVKVFGPGERALRAALSGYNSGDWLRGEKDGYVAGVYKAAGVGIPKLTVAEGEAEEAHEEKLPWWRQVETGKGQRGKRGRIKAASERVARDFGLAVEPFGG